MVPALKPALSLTRSGVVGVLATRATLSGGSYSLVRDRFLDGERVFEIAGDGLVEIVERGEIWGERCGELLTSYLTPFILAGGDVLVLGCTHYPFLIERLRLILGDGVLIVNPAPAVAQQVVRVLGDSSLGEGLGGVDFICSGSQLELLRLESVWGEIVSNKLK